MIKMLLIWKFIIVISIVMIWFLAYICTSLYIDKKVDSSIIEYEDYTTASEVKYVEINGVDIKDVDYASLDSTFKMLVHYDDGTTIEKNGYIVYDKDLANGLVKYEDLNNNNGRIILPQEGEN